MTTLRFQDPVEVEARLLSKVIVSDRGCWEWQGYRRSGYGRMSVDKRLWTVSRIAAHLWLGADMSDRWTLVCHRCDNPPCVNPTHLFVGTPTDNSADCIAKGRRPRTSAPRPELRIYPAERPCVVCDALYVPDLAHRGRSRVCSTPCLNELKSRNAQGRSDKLTASAVSAIKADLAAGRRGKDIAAAYGISRPTVTNIKTGKTWRHVA